MNTWINAETEKPATFESVIVWGVLEDESNRDAHEGYWTGKRWNSVRTFEDSRYRTLSGVTHWMPRPQKP
jgi:hypothetical protein